MKGTILDHPSVRWDFPFDINGCCRLGAVVKYWKVTRFKLALNPCHVEDSNEQRFFLIFILLTCSIPVVKHAFSIRMENSVDPDQMASLEAS